MSRIVHESVTFTSLFLWAQGKKRKREEGLREGGGNEKDPTWVNGCEHIPNLNN